jgi:hypothetical protein
VPDKPAIDEQYSSERRKRISADAADNADEISEDVDGEANG